MTHGSRERMCGTWGRSADRGKRDKTERLHSNLRQAVLEIIMLQSNVCQKARHIILANNRPHRRLPRSAR